ncbi:hypothetical protein Q5762_23385 [Streptomyces sp. P9(2023)]|uniref:hypothetical protein n=1 Tax=Streptomyces sp. P9(2023) TaxID=3064394 RepID=UPI0028F3FA40|nr:hypothetical protein [Streptomyces sp. P9(2023)]MDT9691237.1 hypothetical protein [Streptomyces sp. P9(2023)]
MPDTPGSSHYVSRGVDVQITTEGGGIGLQLNGTPIKVTYVNGEYHSQLANQFTGFPTIDALVESLLETEGRTWTLGGGGHGGGGHGSGGPGHDHHRHGGGGNR